MYFEHNFIHEQFILLLWFKTIFTLVILFAHFFLYFFAQLLTRTFSKIIGRFFLYFFRNYWRHTSFCEHKFYILTLTSLYNTVFASFFSKIFIVLENFPCYPFNYQKDECHIFTSRFSESARLKGEFTFFFYSRNGCPPIRGVKLDGS